MYLFTGPNPQGQRPIRCSQDLHRWASCGLVFQQVAGWIRKASPETKELWAPDISYFNGKYHLSHAFFRIRQNHIWNCAHHQQNARSQAYRLPLRSTKQDDFNAIDPNLVLNGKGGTLSRSWEFLERHQNAAN